MALGSTPFRRCLHALHACQHTEAAQNPGAQSLSSVRDRAPRGFHGSSSVSASAFDLAPPHSCPADTLPDGRVIYRMVLTYKFTPAESGKHKITVPGLNTHIYDNALESQMTMVRPSRTHGHASHTCACASTRGHMAHVRGAKRMPV